MTDDGRLDIQSRMSPHEGKLTVWLTTAFPQHRTGPYGQQAGAKYISTEGGDSEIPLSSNPL